MTKTYTAEYEGEIVGTRKTRDRTYTHAVVVIASQEYYRKRAYEYAWTETDRNNFAFYVQKAEGRYRFGQTNEEMIKASALIDGGFDAYVERVRQREIERFEQRILDGDFLPKVVAWAGRRDLAEKAKREHQQPWNLLVEIVPAIEAVKAPTIKAVRKGKS